MSESSMAQAQILPPDSAQAPPRLMLSRRHKAAIVVRLLLAEGFDLSLKSLPDDLQHALTRAMGDLRGVDRTTLQQVVAEFAEELDGLALTFPAGLKGALDALAPRLSDTAAATLRASLSEGSSDPWVRLCDTEPEVLKGLVAQESPEVSAVLLSKLPVKKAAQLLGLLPGDQARRITFAVSQTSAIRPDAVARIGAALSARLDTTPAEAFSGAPDARVGAILNSTSRTLRDTVITGLEEEDKSFATGVRKAIFTFAHLPQRLAPRELPRITREVEQPVLILALAAAAATEGPEALAGEFVLENLSQRMAAQLRDGVADLGTFKAADGEAAMAEVVEAVRALADAGEITLLDVEED